MTLEKNLSAVLDQIEEAAISAKRSPDQIKLVAVSKGRTIEEIKEAYSLGIRDFAENRVVEALEKIEQLPSDIRWHFIGNLQKNKVNKVIGKFALIHSIDSVELAEKVAKASIQRGVTTSILLEVNTSGEAQKSGLSPREWEAVFSQLLDYQGIEVRGLMAMAPFTEDESVIRHCFSELRLLLYRLNELKADLHTLSMGMTNDFSLAIQEGSTLIRIGTALFIPK